MCLLQQHGAWPAYWRLGRGDTFRVEDIGAYNPSVEKCCFLFLFMGSCPTAVEKSFRVQGYRVLGSGF